jgi:glycosyltransferase involved in cell wall biosynthesis
VNSLEKYTKKSILKTKILYCFRVYYYSLNYKKEQDEINAENHNHKHGNSTVLLIDNFGFSHYTSYLARGLAKYRDIILYAFSRDDYVITGAAREKRIRFYCMEDKLPKGSSIRLTIVRLSILFFILAKALYRREYGTVHIQDRLPMFFLFLPFLKLNAKQICWELHDIDILQYSKGIRGKIEELFVKIVTQDKFLGKHADIIIVHGSSLKRRLAEKGVNQSKIHVMPHFDYRYLLYHTDSSNGNDNLIDTYGNSLSPNNYVLFFGDVTPWKGIDVLINAARIVRKRIGEKFCMLIAGETFRGDMSYYESLGEDESRYIHTYNKYIKGFEIPHILRRARFLVLPYTKAFHSQSGVLSLAYTFSKPVIVSNVGSVAEYVEHGKTGFIFEEGNSSQLAEYITELLDDDSKCIEMGKKAYQKMIEEMSLEKCCEIIERLYREHRK